MTLKLKCMTIIFLIIKLPRYTGSDFIPVVPVRTPPPPPPPILVHAINFKQLFGFLSFLARVLALTYRLTDYILAIFVVTLTLNFQGQISNWLNLSQKWFDCHETKNKHIDWTLGFKWDHRVWPWPWPSPWIFKVKYGIGYISAKNGPIATKRKANTSIEI